MKCRCHGRDGQAGFGGGRGLVWNSHGAWGSRWRLVRRIGRQRFTTEPPGHRGCVRGQWGERGSDPGGSAVNPVAVCPPDRPREGGAHGAWGSCDEASLSWPGWAGLVSRRARPDAGCSRRMGFCWQGTCIRRFAADGARRGPGGAGCSVAIWQAGRMAGVHASFMACGRDRANRIWGRDRLRQAIARGWPRQSENRQGYRIWPRCLWLDGLALQKASSPGLSRGPIAAQAETLVPGTSPGMTRRVRLWRTSIQMRSPCGNRRLWWPGVGSVC